MRSSIIGIVTINATFNDVNLNCMSTVKWKLAEFLKERNISAYRLAQTLDRHTRATTVYGLVKKGEDLSRLDLETLATILDGLYQITGEQLTPNDLLDYQFDKN